MKLGFLLCVLCGVALDAAAEDNVWSRVRQPIAGTPQAIGGYANGCQIGAQVLPAEGRGYVSIRRHRNRFYTQPSTLSMLNHVANTMASFFDARILVGDLSQPIGGKMPYGHSSHQNGLDVDFWFYTVPEGTRPANDIEPPTMVDKAAGRLVSGRWQEAYAVAVLAAAEHPDTARIFVNPVIKKVLCARHYTIDPTERLRKIRPWWGHDAHFHVRLHCPPHNPQCEEQAPIPAGDGCNADLDNWIREQSEAILHPKPPRPSTPKPSKPLHPTCASLIR